MKIHQLNGYRQESLIIRAHSTLEPKNDQQADNLVISKPLKILARLVSFDFL
jgi:hypothetical protein